MESAVAPDRAHGPPPAAAGDRPGADVGQCPFTLPGQSENIPAGGRWNLPSLRTGHMALPLLRRATRTETACSGPLAPLRPPLRPSQRGRRLPPLPILPRPPPPPKFSESRRRSVDDRLPRHPWHLPPVGLRPAASMERLIDRPGADVGPCPFTLPGQSQNIPAGGRWNLPGSKFFEPAGPSWRTSCYM